MIGDKLNENISNTLVHYSDFTKCPKHLKNPSGIFMEFHEAEAGVTYEKSFV